MSPPQSLTLEALTQAGSSKVYILFYFVCLFFFVCFCFCLFCCCHFVAARRSMQDSSSPTRD